MGPAPKVARGLQFRIMTAILIILAAILIIYGIISIVRGSVLLGIVLIIVGFLVGPGGISIFN